MTTQITTKDFFSRQDVRKKFEEMLGKRAPQFITSVLQIASSNTLLSKADPVSIYNSAAVAATLDLPLNNSLGFAYIVPYNVKQPDGSKKTVAQFQIGYKGFIQLAQRSGQFQTISATAIYEGQIIEENPLTGFVFDFTNKKSKVVIGYAAYFKLINGFEKTLYMTTEEVKRHGKRYSQSFGNSSGLWNTDFDAMATKTVLKLLLSKYAPMSVEMQKAVIADQGLINDVEGEDVTYIDNEIPEIDKEKERMRLLIDDCKTPEELQKLSLTIPDEYHELVVEKRIELENTLQMKGE